jgi:hypothetical protein
MGISRSGARTIASADGTSTTTQLVPDPRFGLLSPVQSSTVRLPSGLTSVTSAGRSATFGAGGLLTTLTDSTTINSNAWTSVFDVGSVAGSS